MFGALRIIWHRLAFLDRLDCLGLFYFGAFRYRLRSFDNCDDFFETFRIYWNSLGSFGSFVIARVNFSSFRIFLIVLDRLGSFEIGLESFGSFKNFLSFGITEGRQRSFGILKNLFRWFGTFMPFFRIVGLFKIFLGSFMIFWDPLGTFGTDYDLLGLSRLVSHLLAAVQDP